VRIHRIERFKVNIPFKRKFSISHFTRAASESVFVKVLLEDGSLGWGEALPRNYVTGETQDTVLLALDELFIPRVKGWDIGSFEELVDKLNEFKARKETNNALCAIELALLDAYGCSFKRSISELFDNNKDWVRYSGVVSLNSSVFSLLKMRLFGFKDYKVKVKEDLSKIRRIKNILGNAELRADVNAAWRTEEAMDKIARAETYLSAIEEPVDGIEATNDVAANSNIRIIADESLCTLSDAKKLKNVIFNIRIAKCGGLLKSQQIYYYAKDNGIKCILGCHVGESGVLTAAGRHFALGNDFLYHEGSYNRFLLEKDVTADLTFSKGGIAWPISGHGLGVEVDQDILRKYTVK